MCCGILKGFGGLGAIVALILVVVALLKQLILLVGSCYRAEGRDRSRVHRGTGDDRACNPA